MILKLEKTLQDKQEWLFIDHIKRIDYYYDAISEQTLAEEQTADLIIPSQGTKDRESYTIFLMVLNSGAGYVVATKQNAFLLNDEGKTIEALYNPR